MAHYLRLYAAFVRFSFSRAMEFRLDFFFRIFMDVIFYIVQFLFFLVVFTHTDLLGGWNLDQILIFTVSFIFIDAVNMTFFASNQWWFPIFVNRGDLDYHLTRPVSPLFFVMLREFAANSFVNLLMAAGLMIWVIGRYPAPLGAGNIILYLVMLVVGSLIYAVLHFIFLMPVFWLHSISGPRMFFWEMTKYLERPHQIFTGWMRRILTTVLPFAMIASYPAHLLFDGFNAVMIAQTLTVLAGAWIILLVMWRLGLRAYSSASS